MPMGVLIVAIFVIIASRRWALAVAIEISVESFSWILGGVTSVEGS